MFKKYIIPIILLLIIFRIWSNTKRDTFFWSESQQDLNQTFKNKTVNKLQKILKDYVNFKTKNKTISFHSQFNLEESQDGFQFKSTSFNLIKNSLALSLQKYLSHTITKKESDQLKQFFSLHNFLQNIYKSIEIHNKKRNWKQATYFTNIDFTPIYNQNINFNNELSTNNLIRLTKSGTLYSYITSSYLKKIEQIYKINFPYSEKFYHYVGGNISLWLKISKLRDKGITTANGFIRFRKYFKTNTFFDNYNEKSSKRIKINNILNSTNLINKNSYATIDYYLYFNKQTPLVYSTRYILSFGSLRYNDSQNNDSTSFNSSKDLSTNSFQFSGRFLLEEHWYPFKITPQTLVFNEKLGTFNIKKSKFKVMIITSKLTDSKKEKITNQLKLELLKRNPLFLIKVLNLSRFLQ